MKSLDVTLRLPPSFRLSLPEQLAVEDAVVREEMIAWTEYADVVTFLSLVVGDLATVRRAVDDLDVVQRVDYAPVDDDTFYLYAEMELRPVDAALWSTFEDRRLVVVPPVIYPSNDRVRMTVLGDGEALRSAIDGFPEDVGVEIERLSDHRRLSGSLAGRLTARQFEAVETARRLGYYEVPRESSLATVADELDCSESAASALLRKAERALVDVAVGK